MCSWGQMAMTLGELDIAKVLLCGQSFRWRKEGPEIVGVFGGRAWGLKQNPTHLQYRLIAGAGGVGVGVAEPSPSQLESALSQYFQLDISLPSLYARWAEKDPRFQGMKEEWGGIRILAQDPVETIFSFICSSNNHIGRIGGMVEKLCSLYGPPIPPTTSGGGGSIYHDFPSLEALAQPGVEATLRQESFGYRAGYIASSAQKILELGGRGWVEGLRGRSYTQARTQLQTLPGIGRKVADCICLMSLGFSETVPVDTHMHQVAKTYLPHLAKVKTLTDKGYEEIVQHFQSLYGQYAGWAQAVLFASRLKHLQQTTGSNPSAVPEDPKEKKKTAKKNKKAETVDKQIISQNDGDGDKFLDNRRSKRSRISK